MSNNENNDISNILNTSASPADDDETNLKQKMTFIEKNVQRLNVDVRNLFNVIGLGDEKSIMEASNFMVCIDFDAELKNIETPKRNYFDSSIISQGQNDQKESLNQNSFSTTENSKKHDSAIKRSNDSSSNDNNSNYQERNGQKENLNQNNALSTHKYGYDSNRTIVNESIINPKISLLQENEERKLEIMEIESKISKGMEELRGGAEEIRDQMEKANEETNTRIDTLNEEMKKMNEEMKKMRDDINQISVLGTSTMKMMRKINEKLDLLPKA